MKNQSLTSLVISLLLSSLLFSQVGINTETPASTIDVRGSFAAQYNAVTATTYAMTGTDFHVSYNGAANATFTLPAAQTGTANFKGRLYTIKNNTAFTVTVNPAATETINGSASITVPANQSVQLISTGLTGAAATWEVAGGAGSSSVTASNGLNAAANDVKLGGNLLQATTVTNNTFPLNIAGSGSTTTFAANGNVGIGTTSPSTKLFVNDDVNGGVTTTIRNTNAGNAAYSNLYLRSDGTQPLSIFLNSTTRTADGGINTATIRNEAGDLRLLAQNSAGMMVKSTTGYVGINNFNPRSSLHLSGSVTSNITNPITDASMILTGGNLPRVYWENTGAAAGQRVFSASYTDTAKLIFGGVSDNATIGGTYTGIMTLDNNNGNIGIGTTSPGAKLDVQGSATNVSGYNAGASATIDFSNSNLAYTTATATGITLTGIKDGGAYTLIFTSTAATGVVSFTAAGFSFKYMGTNGRISGKTHIYSLIVVGTTAYVTMATEN